MNKQKEIINMISEEVQKAVDVQLKEQRDEIIKIIDNKYEELLSNPGEEDDIALKAFQEVLDKIKTTG